MGNVPQNGDIIILYAEDRSDLNEMIRAGESFEGLKKILVVSNTSGIDGSMYHKLSPRYITQADRSIEELESVIGKMKMQVQ